MRYIMITNFDNHWSNLKNNITYYPKSMLRKPLNESKLIENTPTIFIKKDKKTKEIEGVWRGKVFNISVHNEKIHFTVFIDKEIKCPEKYRNDPEGWYIEEDGIINEEKSIYDPPFFLSLINTTNEKEFEELTYKLLRVIGIHNIHWYSPRKQAGLPDGFFRFKNLAVIYDCTLNTSFEEYKHQQKENFSGMLKKDSISFKNDIGEKKVEEIIDCSKQVWIITKNKDSRIIERRGEVKVKEVPIMKIIELYRRRLEREIDDETLEESLKNI